MESIIFTTDASIVLAELLGGIRHENLFIVADKHTVGFCDRLFEKVDWIPSHVTVLDCGEEYKSIESVSRIWTMLSKRGARRSSILVCVGCVGSMFPRHCWRRLMLPWGEKPGLISTA